MNRNTLGPIVVASGVLFVVVQELLLSPVNTLSAQAESQTPQQFKDAYLRFVLSVQSHLGDTGEAPSVF